MINKKMKVQNRLIEIILWGLSVLTFYPLAMIVLTSFKSYSEAGQLNISLPEKILFSNYVVVFNEGKIFRSFINSSVITICSVILLVALSSMLAFIIVRKKSSVNNIFYKLLIMGIIAPFAPLPTIKMLQVMGIYGSYISVILVYTALYMPFSTMLIRSFIQTIPVDMDEAAIIDGCSGTGLFYKIVFPLLKPVIVTVGVLDFMWVWNDFQYPIYLLNSSSKWTLPLSVYNFFGKYGRSWHLVTADMVMITLPIIIIYLLAQKYIISGMVAGAVKG